MNFLRPERLWLFSCSLYRRGWPRLARCVKYINFVLYKCLLPFEADVASDIHLEHWALTIVIHPNVRIGKRVRIYHGVTLAAETSLDGPLKLIVEDGVTIGAGAIVIARSNRGITLGAGCYIGAGAVVTNDVLPGQTVVGVPAVPIETRRNAPACLPRETYSDDLHACV